jgi:hypothetical protein
LERVGMVEDLAKRFPAGRTRPNATPFRQSGVKGPSNRPSRKNGGQPSAKPARGCNAHAKFVVLHDPKGLPRLLWVGVGHLAEGEWVSREDAKARRVLHRELKENLLLLLLRCFA